MLIFTSHPFPSSENRPQEYEELAVALGTDHKRRLALREQLKAVRLTCPLFDTRRWVSGADSHLQRHRITAFEQCVSLSISTKAHVCCGDVPTVLSCCLHSGLLLCSITVAVCPCLVVAHVDADVCLRHRHGPGVADDVGDPLRWRRTAHF